LGLGDQTNKLIKKQNKVWLAIWYVPPTNQTSWWEELVLDHNYLLEFWTSLLIEALGPQTRSHACSKFFSASISLIIELITCFLFLFCPPSRSNAFIENPLLETIPCFFFFFFFYFFLISFFIHFLVIYTMKMIKAQKSIPNL
jgi:hypothetical protein